MSGPTIDVQDAEGATVTVAQPVGLGQATMANSKPVVIASDQSAVPVARANVAATGNALNAATANAAYTVPAPDGQGVAAFAVSGLTAAGAVLTAEVSNDGGTTWSAANTTAPGSGALSSTVAADGQFRVNIAGHTHVRLRVSTTGTGTITVASNLSAAGGLVGLSTPLPAGANIIGNAGVLGANGTGPASNANPLPTTPNNDVFFNQSVALSTNAYVSGDCIGGLITLAGLTPNAIYTLQYLHATVTPSPSAGLSAVADIFDANPTASTFTDNAASSLAAADAAKRVLRSASSPVAAVSGETTYLLNAFATNAMGNAGTASAGSAPMPVKADAGGNVYIAVTAGAAFSALTSGLLIVRACLRR